MDQLKNTNKEKIYSAIGKFAVKFEDVCYFMRLAIIFVLKAKGLQDIRLAQALLSDLTADPLRKNLQSFFAIIDVNDQEKYIIEKILTRVDKLTEKRNKILHGAWFVDNPYPTEDSFPKVSGVKLHRSKKGVEENEMLLSTAEFHTLSLEADQLISLLRGVCFSIGYNEPLNKFIELDSDGNIFPTGNIFPE